MSLSQNQIKTPDSPILNDLCEKLSGLSGSLQSAQAWPKRQLELCGQYGVYRWFIPIEMGGFGWSNRDIASGYIQLAAACMTTTFVLTQRVAACRRIVSSENADVLQRLVPGLASGDIFATVGVSHLSTSRRHLEQPVLRALEQDSGFQVDGFSPWVTGGLQADQIVMGATLSDRRQVLFVVDRDSPGLSPKDSFELVGLSGSQTGAVHCDHVFVPRDNILKGPVENVMSSGTGGTTGGLQTSTLAIGLATAAVSYIRDQARMRNELQENLNALQESLDILTHRLLCLADGQLVCTNEEIRAEANSLVLRATQSALVAAKGAGYVVGHPVGRWCQEALFFLVWSCPQAVLNANLCELAGIES